MTGGGRLGEPFLEFVKAIVLAVVEGATEFLPVSSTGHLILVEEIFRLSDDIAFNDAFLVIIQLPAILSVVVYFWKDLWPFSSSGEKRRDMFWMWAKLVVAFLPAAVLGFLFDDLIEKHLFAPLPVAAALFVGGVVILLIERIPRNTTTPLVKDVSFQKAFLIGLVQCLAMFPGTSRSAATIVGAMLLGLSRPAAAEFSFFLAIPTMVGATTYKVATSGLAFTPPQWGVLAVGSLTSFLVAYAVIAAFMNYIRKRDFVVFGWYRIVLAGVIVAAVWLS